MLTELDIREFGLMEHVQLHFSSGMTVFTGETGAGKSILIHALSAVFGARTRADWVRHGAKSAELTAVIEDNHPTLLQLLEEQGLETSEALILRRMVGSDGRSRAWLNGTPVPLKLLQQIGVICLDIHAQHEHQSLMKDTTQRQWLDNRIKPKLLENTATAFTHLKHARQTLQAFVANQGESQAQLHWMRAELTRLEPLNLRDGLHESLSKEVDRGQHIAHIQQAGAQAAQRLDHLDTAEWDESRLKKELSDAENTYQQAATALHQARVKAGQQLQHDLRPYLDRLGMQGMRLDIQLHAQESHHKKWQAHGWDSLDVLFSSNPGEPFRPLADVASGGELSRFALALKASGAFDLSPQTAVFDEVDVGVGGETGWCVGELTVIQQS